MDFANQKARKVGVFTDGTIAKLLPMKMALESLEENGVKYEVFDRVRVEPNQQSCVFPPFSLPSPHFRPDSAPRPGLSYPFLRPHSVGTVVTDLAHCTQLGGRHRVRQAARL